MSEKGIIFSAPMVRALIEGRKTQTRRVLNPQPVEDTFYGPEMYAPIKIDRHGEAYPGADVFGIYGDEWGQRLPYAPGQRLWVREAFRGARGYDGAPPSRWGNKPIWYVADGQPGDHWGFLSDRARPSIHMPRWASRITLTVTDVRVQRLAEITEADAAAEGIDDDFSCVRCFAELWNSLHGPEAWGENPFVCAISFTVALRNIDAGVA